VLYKLLTKILNKVIKGNAATPSSYEAGYVDALDRIANAVARLEKQPERSVPELKVMKEILSIVFFLKIDTTKNWWKNNENNEEIRCDRPR
jgi:hypothetical protein